MDAGGNAYIAGDTESADFPRLNPVQSVFGGKTDAFVTKLTASGAISFSTFLGGINDEHVGGVAVDAPEILPGRWYALGEFPSGRSPASRERRQ